MSKFADVPGWYEEDTRDFTLAKAAEAEVIVNIGVWKGLSVLEMADVTPGVVFAVDHFHGWDGHPGTTIEKGSSLELYTEFLSNVVKYDLAHKIVPMCMSSQVAATYFKPGSVDLVYVDGGHFLYEVLLDLTYWWDKLKPGGMMCGHDHNQIDVRRAVDIFARSMQYKVCERGILWYLEEGRDD